MTKAGRPRRRYIVFQALGTSNTNEDLQRTVLQRSNQLGLRSVKMIQFDGTKGIVRVSLEEKDRLMSIINSTPEGTGFRTARTSGTLRSLRERYFPTASESR